MEVVFIFVLVIFFMSLIYDRFFYLFEGLDFVLRKGKRNFWLFKVNVIVIENFFCKKCLFFLIFVYEYKIMV